MGGMAPKQPAKQPEIGPIGRNLARAVAALRERRGLTYKKLSELLEATGRPIFPLGLSRLEKDDRRVDVDELVALSVVFGVSPLALLFPRDADWDDDVELTPEVRHRLYDVWQWGRAIAPLPETGTESGAPFDRAADFAYHSLPHPADATIRTDPALSAATNLAGRIQAVLRDQPGPDDWEGRKAWLRRSYEMAGLALEDMIARGDEEAKRQVSGERLRQVAPVQGTQGPEREKVL